MLVRIISKSVSEDSSVLGSFLACVKLEGTLDSGLFSGCSFF